MKTFVICGHSDRREKSWTALMSAIYSQAIRDARGEKIPQALDAALWLSGPDASTFLDAIGLDVDPLSILVSGRARKLARVGIQDV